MGVWWTWCRMQVNAGPGRVVDRRLVLGEMCKRLWSVGFLERETSRRSSYQNLGD